MQLKSVKKNPINSTSGFICLSSVEDAFFGTPGLWSYRKDEITGHHWLDPRPDDESIGLIYQTYYTHDDGSEGNFARPSLWEQSLAFAQSRILGYRTSFKISSLAKLLSFMPTVADAATLDLMRLPATKIGRLLDIGCGSGEFMKKMRTHGWDVVGMEPDQQAAARLTQSEGVAVYSSFSEITLGEASPFDFVVLSHVIEHVPDPIQTLRELRKYMGRNGRLIVTTPNIAGLGAQVFGRFWRGLEPPRHFNVFTPESLKLAFKAAGFEIEQCTTEVRMARGIWYLSYLARQGNRDVEIHRVKARQGLKISGYIFQLIEAMIVKVFPGLGEELYCVGFLPTSSVMQIEDEGA